jgi:hypothetical protein
LIVASDWIAQHIANKQAKAILKTLARMEMTLQKATMNLMDRELLVQRS